MKRCQTEADRLVNAVIPARPFGEPAIGNTELWKNNPEDWDAARAAAVAQALSLLGRDSSRPPSAGTSLSAADTSVCATCNGTENL